jgi:hypothetical protein
MCGRAGSVFGCGGKTIFRGRVPRAAPSDSWRSLRSARVPPVDYLDKPLRLSLGATLLNPGVRFAMSKRVQFRMSVDPVPSGAARDVTVGGIAPRRRVQRRRAVGGEFVAADCG